MSADGLRVAVVGADPSTIEAPDGTGLTGSVADSDVIVAVGESTLREVGEAAPPVLPVDAGRGVRSVPAESVTDALASVAAGDYERWSTPRLAISAGDERVATALFDAMIVTAEPAHISEFSVRTPREPLDQFRADGVHVATAAGTAGYARRVEAPVFDPETPAAAVVPIAPFAIDPDHWVVPVRAEEPLLELTVERDEATVTLLADDRTVGPVEPHVPVTVAHDGTVDLVSVPQSTSPFASPDGSPRLE